MVQTGLKRSEDHRGYKTVVILEECLVVIVIFLAMLAVWLSVSQSTAFYHGSRMIQPNDCDDPLTFPAANIG